MSMPASSVPTQKAVETLVDPAESAPSPTQEYLNGISPVTALRLGTLLTRDNIGWTVVGLVAADYFGITNQLLGLVGNVC